MKSAILHFKD